MFFLGQVCNHFQLPQDSNVSGHTSYFNQQTHRYTGAQLYLLFKQCVFQTGHCKANYSQTGRHMRTNEAYLRSEKMTNNQLAVLIL